MQTSQTNERALEMTIERYLTGTCLEDQKAQAPANAVADGTGSYLGGLGYHAGNPQDFDAQYAIDKTRFWDFLESTQATELAKLQKQSDWKRKILERLDRMLKKYGLVYLLRKGLEVDDAHFTLMYSLPLASSSDTIKKNFERNQFSITRQVHYSLTNANEAIDMALFINGLPFATIELKNHWTGQNARVHGQNQYKKRDQNQPLLQFARCIVHFALDTEEVYMTTKLEGASTFFLPFNKGNNYGKGNPINPQGHRTAYFWEQILTRESVANIIQQFVRLAGKESEPLSKKTLYFPRYHQLDVVRQVVKHASQNGVGQTYLIQHSAGSGKSNSITWTAYQLIETYPETSQTKGSKGINQPLFDSIIVVTDRRLLDQQLRDNIKEFSQVKTIVAPAQSSKELKEHLEANKKIIITTIQKFPFIIDGIADLSSKTFAVIIDEAHSSQGGTSAGKLNQAMGNSPEDEDAIDAQELILEAIRARKMRGNASYFAFTATPKNNTLERFGVRQEDGSYRPFHLYSMKQAIEEGFILDVLANYTTYRSYYEIEKSIEENPFFETAKAQKKLRQYVETHQQTINTKADIMLEHFITKIVSTKKLKGKAKAMIVTQSIETAIRYYYAVKEIIAQRNNPFKVLVAFSGKKTVDGIEHTEDSLNGFAEKETKNKFDEDEYRILIVANKYLTGFDQPKLTAMYIDKKLQGVLAVQALSRLNRSAQKYDKRTEDLFVLDFFNTTEEIEEAFNPFYTSTKLSHATDVNVLHELKSSLDYVGVYEWEEVVFFTDKYFAGVDAQELSAFIDVASERFNHTLGLEETAKADFKIKAKQFVKIYAQMASILPFEVVKWEQLFWFLKFLIPKLIIQDTLQDSLDDLLNAVDLSTYGLERVRLNVSIALDEAETALDPQNPNPRGVHETETEEDPLDLIIQAFNERWFQGWSATPEEQRVKFVHIAKSIQNHPDFQAKLLDTQDPQSRELAFVRIYQDVMIQQRKNELELYKLLSNDETFSKAFQDTIKRMLKL